MTDTVERSDASSCFVCGSENPHGLQIKFSLDGAFCRGIFQSSKTHVGFDGVTHGGIVFAVLDDAMANWFYLQGARGYTAKAEIRYRNPLPVGVRAEIECEVLKRKGRLVQLKARIFSDEQTFAESEGSFMLEDFGNLNGDQT